MVSQAGEVREFICLVEALLKADKQFTGYRIAKELNELGKPVSRVTISKLRTGKSELMNTPLGTVISLHDFAKKYELELVKKSVKSQFVSGYHIKISLEGTRPVIWRKVRIKEQLTFYDLHRIIQESMGWENYHLHEFVVAGGIVSEDCLIDEALLSGYPFYYTYDFGDYWQHKIELVKELTRIPDNESFPKVMAFNCSCPPEDCGGSFGFHELKKILKSKRGARYREVREWLGSGTLEPYDKEAVNEWLKVSFTDDQ